MTKLIIVGAGVCGSMLARAATAAGHEFVLVNDDKPIDSLSAAAVLRRAWHKDHERTAFDRSMALYAEWGIPLLHGAVVTSYRRSSPKQDSDWRMIAPSLPLLEPNVRGHATAIPGGVKVGSRTLLGKVLWATGRYGDGATGLTHGFTWIHDDPRAGLVDPGIMRVHHVAPYKSVMAGAVGGKGRFGSSSASSKEKAWEQALYFRKLGVTEGIIRNADDWYPVYGMRVKTTPSATLGGMHRTGYALAPALAESVIKNITVGV